MMSSILRPVLRVSVVLALACVVLLTLGPSSAFAGRWTVAPISGWVGLLDGPAMDRYGGTVVWADSVGGDWEVFVHDVGGAVTERVSHAGWEDRRPQVCGPYVVWQAREAGADWEIFLYCTPSGPLIRMTDNAYDDYQPATHDGVVAWVSHSARPIPSYSLWMALAPAPAATCIASSLAEIANPQVGDGVVWQGRGLSLVDRDWEIFWFREGVTRRLTDNAWEDEAPQMDGAAVAWAGFDGHDTEIYYCEEDAAPLQLSDNDLPDHGPRVARSGMHAAVAWNQGTGDDQHVVAAERSPGSDRFWPRVTEPSTGPAEVGDVRMEDGGLGEAMAVTWAHGDASRHLFHQAGIGGYFFSSAMVARGEPIASPGVMNRQGLERIAYVARDHLLRGRVFLATRDALLPTLSITWPEAGALLSGDSARISGVAKDNESILSVGVWVGDADGHGVAEGQAVLDSGEDTPVALWHFDWDLPVGVDGAVYTIEAATHDLGGYWVDVTPFGVRVDTLGPRVASFQVEGGAAFTLDSLVTASWNSTDASPPLQVRFSNDGLVWGPWESSPPPWPLSPGYGVKQVFFQMRDAAGNKSTPTMSDMIIHLADAFSDVGAFDHYADAIYFLRTYGILHGYRSGSGWEFRPGNVVWRAQFAKMVCGALAIPVTEGSWPEGGGPFTDLGADDPTDLYPHDFVGAAHAEGITMGLTPGTFGPYLDITRAQLVTMVVRAVDSRVPDILEEPSPRFVSSLGSFDPVHGPTMAKAEYNGLLAGLLGFGPGWDPWTSATRAETAQVLWNVKLALGYPK